MPNKGTIPRVCETCAAPFLAHAGNVNAGNGRFCSLTCRPAHNKNRVISACTTCGAEISRSPATAAASKSPFCSRACYWQQPKLPNATCARCGIAYRIKAKKPTAKFCSRACSSAHQSEARVIPIEDRIWKFVQKTDGCWEWNGRRNDRGYGLFAVTHAAARRAHRVIWELVNGPIPSGMVVCHRCDNPPCVRPDHLFLGTQADNMRDMQAKGRKANQYTHQTVGTPA